MDMTKFFLHQIATPGLPGGITDEEAAIIRADQATILARPVIDQLTDLADVTDTPVDGETLVWDAATSTWVPGTAGGTITDVRDHTGAVVVTDVSSIVARLGLTAVDSNGRAAIQPVYGTDPDTIAEGDHAHVLHRYRTYTAAASGSLSSGTRTLISDTISGLLADRSYELVAWLVVDIRGEGTGAGRSRPQVTINGVTETRHNPVRTVAGVDREASMIHPGVLVSGVTSVTVTAAVAHVDGDPKYIDAARLVVMPRNNR